MFPTTRWTLIRQVNHELTGDSRKALEELCQQYAQPVFGFVRRRISSYEEAEDATQDFFARLINGSLLQKADPQHGRFRSYLLHAVRDFLADLNDYKTAVKRGGRIQHVTLEPQTLFTKAGKSAEQEFELQWVRTTLQAALNDLQSEYKLTQREHIFEALKGALDDTETI